MKWRLYDPDKDKEAVGRVLSEVGWLDLSKEEDIRAQDAFSSSGRAFVAELGGEPECLVNTHEGTLRHLDTDLSMCGVTGVATSRVARKQGLAGRLTARAVAASAADGIETSGLGMFEQGFYNRAGFATGVYEHTVRFDPAHLNVKKRARVPARFTKDDWKDIHAARLGSMKRHGSATIFAPEFTFLRTRDGFGMGYRADDGSITHHVWFTKPKSESGPLGVQWVSFETLDQFVELLALMKGLGDQFRTVRMTEPPGVQLQDFVRHPFREEIARAGSDFRTGVEAGAFWQVRINDLPACFAKTHLCCDEARFNLELTDPIAEYLPDGDWRGAGGEFVVTLSDTSSAEPGADKSLPTLSATVNAFTRMWFGVLPATTLAVSDDLSGDAALIAALDRAFLLPRPQLGWFF